MPELPVRDISASKRLEGKPERIATAEELRALRAKTITPEPAIEAAIEEVLYPKKSERAIGVEEPRFAEKPASGAGVPSLLFPQRSAKPVTEEPELLEKLLRAEARGEKTERKSEGITKVESETKNVIDVALVADKKDAGLKAGATSSRVSQYAGPFDTDSGLAKDARNASVAFETPAPDRSEVSKNLLGRNFEPSKAPEQDAGLKPGATNSKAELAASSKSDGNSGKSGATNSSASVDFEEIAESAKKPATQAQSAPVSEKLAAVVQAAEIHVSEKKSEEVPAAKPTILDRLAAVMRPSEVAPPEPEVAEVVAPAPVRNSKMLVEEDDIEVPEIDLLELGSILDQHRIWAESGGEEGVRADLSGVNLSHAELTGSNLQGAIFNKARLRGADLSMANLRGASLVQADLRDTNLLGTELRGANLMGATLYGADGLWVGRLGGTNLFDTMLPEAMSSFDGSSAVEQATRSARWFYFLMLGVSFACVLVVALTTDVRLILDGPAVPIPRYGRILPINGVYLGAPILLAILYARFHFLLLSLWGSMAALPAVFQNGRTLEKEGQWYLMGLVRKHFRWLSDSKSPLQRFEGIVANLMAYWAVPATVLVIWLRYLVRQDMRGTLLQILIFMATVAAATSLPSLVSRILRPGEIRKPTKKGIVRVTLWSLRAALGGAAVLLLLSFGIIHGLPSDPSSAPEVAAASPRRWAADVIRVTGLRPYADLTEATLITPGTRRSPTEDTTGDGVGPGLNQMQLRFARAYRAYLPSARMWRADLEGAYLTEADVHGANLREAKLRDAVLDHTRAQHAIFISANGSGANLTGADLRNADLTYSVFENALFAGAKLDEASIYGANLRNTRWLRAELTRADVRDTQMQGADLSFANLELADFSGAKLEGAQLTGAQLKGTIFLGANLRRVDMRGAFFGAAILRDAVMDGANIEGADLHGTLGLTAEQICTTRGWQTASFDADIAADVLKTCKK